MNRWLKGARVAGCVLVFSGLMSLGCAPDAALPEELVAQLEDGVEQDCTAEENEYAAAQEALWDCGTEQQNNPGHSCQQAAWRFNVALWNRAYCLAGYCKRITSICQTPEGRNIESCCSHPDRYGGPCDDGGTADGGGTTDGGRVDGCDDAGTPDGGSDDAGSDDAGDPDGGGEDAGSDDDGGEDAGSEDAGDPDAGTSDDGGESDAG